MEYGEGNYKSNVNYGYFQGNPPIMTYPFNMNAN